MQVLSGAIGHERLHVEAPPRDQLEEQAIQPIGEGRSRAYRLHWPGAGA
jgi:hypothetical protein